MKKIPLCSLSVCLSAILAVIPALGRGPAPVLARVEAVDRIDRLGLPVYAHLLDAGGRAYALVLATEAELEQAGWPFTVLASDPDISCLAIVIERLPGARDRARKQIDVLYDDGRRFIITPTPEQTSKLMGLGMAVIRINTPMAWPSDPEGRAASLLARCAVPANSTISNLMNQVSQDTVSNLVALLSGDKQATIGGKPYTIMTRGTSSGTPIQEAYQFVYEQMQAAGLEVSCQGWTNDSISGSNVVGVKRGAALSNETVLITAHIDSMPNDGTRSPGADDNASGCVGVMVAANIFSNCTTDRTIRFICFGGEEQGLLGSDAYARLIKNAGETNVTVFNMDMIAYSTIASHEMFLHTRLSTAPDYAADMAVANTFRDVISSYGLNSRLTAVITNSGEEASDHYSFWRQGCPGVLAIESDNNFNTNYHKASDLIANINMTYLTDFIRASVGTVGHLVGVHAAPAKAAGISVSDGKFKDKIRISWSPVEEATGYLVWRNTSNDWISAQLVGTTAATNIDDTGIKVNHIYTYWIQATNDYGPGEFSDSDTGYELLGPCIWANEMDETVAVSQGSNLTVEVEINPDIYEGVNADWWVVALAGSSWFYMDNTGSWRQYDGNLSNCRPVYQGALFDLPATEVLNITGLPPGSYTFWFAVDYPMDGMLDLDGPIWADSVDVIVQ